MREYIDEMVFDFYPNADGLLIESSDYAVCNCPECGPKYYDHEFKFVREFAGISLNIGQGFTAINSRLSLPQKIEVGSV